MMYDLLAGLRNKLEEAIERKTPEALADFLDGVSELSGVLRKDGPGAGPRGDELGAALDAVEEAWSRGTIPPGAVLSDPARDARLSKILDDILSFYNFALSLANGDLSHSLEARGVVAGSLKSLHGSLRHLTWQTRMIARGDLTQRVDFLGEFSESFNSMVESLAAARDKIDLYNEELLQTNETLADEVHERRVAEEALVKVRDELEVRVLERTAELELSNRSLRAYADRLELTNRELQEFAFVAAHDLQEPLRKIRTFADRLGSRIGETIDATAKDYLGRMNLSASRMQELLHDLLKFSLAASRPGSFEEVHLDGTVREASKPFEPKLEETGGSIGIGPLPVIEANAKQMVELFQHLLGNAVRYRSDLPPRIRVYSEKGANDCCRIFVEDNGIGFDEKFLDRIFSPFQKLHGRNEYEGTGMGLAVCRKIVERHGGSITARSTQGKGSTFVVTLPVHHSGGR